MLALFLAACVAQPTPRVAVVDVSAPDAIYEDVSRGLADQVVEALRQAGAEAVRIEEAELPAGGCRLGPCLGVLARAKQAQVVVMLDATEVDQKHSGVEVAALGARDGRPIAARRYVAVAGKPKPPPLLERFVADVIAQTKKLIGPADAGAAAPVRPAAR